MANAAHNARATMVARACSLWVLVVPSLCQAASFDSRQALAEHLVQLSDPSGRGAVVRPSRDLWHVANGLEGLVTGARWQVHAPWTRDEVSWDGHCVVDVSRKERVYVVETSGECVSWPDTRSGWASDLLVVPGVGNRGVGGTVGLSATRWYDGTTGLGVRVWGLAELVPDQRRAAGAELLLCLADGPALVEVGLGAATSSEVRTICVGADCSSESRGPLRGAAISGMLAARIWARPNRFRITAGVRAQSLPGRGFSVGLALGAGLWPAK